MMQLEGRYRIIRTWAGSCNKSSYFYCASLLSKNQSPIIIIDGGVDERITQSKS